MFLCCFYSQIKMFVKNIFNAFYSQITVFSMQQPDVHLRTVTAVRFCKFQLNCGHWLRFALFEWSFCLHLLDPYL